MLLGTLVGNITRDAEVRDAGGNKVCGFSVASNDQVKGEKVTTFVDCSLWGTRGEKLAQYLTKGKSVTVVGKLSKREHDGKTYLQMEASEVAFGGGPSGSGGAQPADTQQKGDDIPF